MATQTDNNSRRVLFDPDGFAIDRTDDNNSQLFAMARQMILWASGITNAVDDPSSPGTFADLELGQAWNQQSDGADANDLVFAPFPGAGFVGPGLANHLTLYPGPLMLFTGAPFASTGEEFVSYWVNTPIDLTTAVGDATNPRIDLVEIKAEWVDGDAQSRHFEDATTRAPSSQTEDKERGVQITVQIKQGTPAATPAYPAPTAGFAPLAAVRVPALHNGVHTVSNLRDMRWPLGGLRVIDVDARGFWLQGTNPWLLNEAGMYVETDGATTAVADSVIVQCPIGAKSARLLGVGIYGAAAGNPSVELVRIDHNLPATPTITQLADLDTGQIFDVAGFNNMGAIELMDPLGVAGTPQAGARLANRRVGSPMWCNGYAAGSGQEGSIPETPFSKLGVRIKSENDGSDAFVSFVRFYVAQGL